MRSSSGRQFVHDDEQMIFESCRRHQKLNENVNLKSVHFVRLHNCITMHIQFEKNIWNYTEGGEVA